MTSARSRRNFAASPSASRALLLSQAGPHSPPHPRDSHHHLRAVPVAPPPPPSPSAAASAPTPCLPWFARHARRPPNNLCDLLRRWEASARVACNVRFADMKLCIPVRYAHRNEIICNGLRRGSACSLRVSLDWHHRRRSAHGRRPCCWRANNAYAAVACKVHFADMNV